MAEAVILGLTLILEQEGITLETYCISVGNGLCPVLQSNYTAMQRKAPVEHVRVHVHTYINIACSLSHTNIYTHIHTVYTHSAYIYS